MPVVKIGVSRQVVIPRKLHDQLKLTPGDYLEVELKGGQLILTPKMLIEKRLAEGLEDIKKGRISRPFDSAETLIHHLHQGAKKAAREKKSRPR